MTVIGLQDFVSAAIARQNKGATVSAGVTSTPSTETSSSETAGSSASSYSTISSQSLSTASLASASASVAQLSSVLQVTQGAADEVQSLLQQLQNLAGQPTPGTEVSSATLARINSQFQQILSQISRIATGTTFNDVPLLDGAYTGISGSQPEGNGGAATPTVKLPDLTLSSLFGGEQPNLLTQESVAQAVVLVAKAKSNVEESQNSLSNIQGQVEYAAATLQTVQSNADASKSVLTEADFAGTPANLLGELAQQPLSSAQLQTDNLSPSLLSLLQE